MRRRNFIKSSFLFMASTQLFSNNLFHSYSVTKSNFKFIYNNQKLKNEFYKFLKHVFNIYPESQFHKLINDTTIQKNNDQEIYREAQSKLEDITPTLSSLRYQLPALQNQKDEMAKETVQLLGEEPISKYP